jgi:hypothetical protein
MLFAAPEKSKSEAIQKLIKAEVERAGVRVLHISAFGFKFDSAFWIGVQTDAQKERLSADAALHTRLQAIFDATSYRKFIEDKWGDEFRRTGMANLLEMGIVFESQQTVDRDFSGNWFHAMK